MRIGVLNNSNLMNNLSRRMTILEMTMFFIGFDEESIIMILEVLWLDTSHSLFNVNEPNGAKQP